MIHFYCDKIYHNKHDIKGKVFPSSPVDKLDLDVSIVLLSLLYISVTEKYRKVTENKTKSLVLYLFHPKAFAFDYHQIENYKDVLSIMHIFKKDKHLKEFTEYYIGEDFLPTRTILIFPVYSESEKTLTHLIVYDILSNDCLVFSPFTDICRNVFSPNFDTTYLQSLEVPVLHIIFICKCYNMLRMYRPFLKEMPNELNDIKENDLLLKRMLDRLKFNKLVVSKKHLENIGLGVAKYSLVFTFFKKIIQGIVILAWPKDPYQTNENLYDIIEEQENFLDYILDNVFVKVSNKFSKNTIFGLTITDMDTQRLFFKGLLNDYQNGEISLDFDLLNFHYMHCDIEGEHLLWDQIAKYDQIQHSHPANREFSSRVATVISKYLSNWLESTRLQKVELSRCNIYEAVRIILRQEYELKMIADKHITNTESNDKEYNVSEENTDTEDDEGTTKDAESDDKEDKVIEENTDTEDGGETTNDTESDDKEDKVIEENTDTEDGGELNVTLNNKNILDVLSLFSKKVYSPLLDETSFISQALNTLLSVEIKSIEKDINKRVLSGLGRAPPLYLCSYEYQLIETPNECKDKLEFKDNYLKLFYNTTNFDVKKWINSRSNIFDLGIESLRNNTLFKFSNGRYFIPLWTMSELVLNTKNSFSESDNISIRMYWSRLKKIILYWLLELPTDKKFLNEKQKKEMKETKITSKLICNLDWFSDVYHLMNK